MSDERWQPIPGYEDKYEVSDYGAVRGLTRISDTAKGRTTVTGRYLNHSVLPKGYHQVALYSDGKRTYLKVHRLVLEAFTGPCPEGMQARHLNGVPYDNRLENLAWGTASENTLDQVAQGTHWAARAEECPYGHPYSGDNLIISPSNGQRICRACRNKASREWQRRKREERRASK